MTRNGQQIVRVKEFTNHPYAWPGGYPLFAITSDGAALCASCTKKKLGNIVTAIARNLRDGWKVEGIDVNWEDADLTCDHCGQHIESAYAD